MAEKRTPQNRGWRAIERYAFVSRPYEEVWPWLASHLSTLGDRLPDGGRSVELHIRPAGRDISRAVRLQVGGLVCVDGSARAAVHWADAAHPRLFPKLTAVLELQPLPNDARPFTQVGVQARYRPPLGPVGLLGDALLGSEIADAAITNFLDDVVAAINSGLPPTGEAERPVVDLAFGEDPNLRRLFITVDGLGIRSGGAVGVYEALCGLPGVVHVSVDPWNGLVAVDHDPGRCGMTEITAVLDRRAPASSSS